MNKLKVFTVLPVFTLSSCFSSRGIHNLSVAQTVLYISNVHSDKHVDVRLANETLCDLEARPDSASTGEEHFKP